MASGTIRFENGAIEVDAMVLAEALGLEPLTVLRLVRSGEITTCCERGLGADAGRYRLTFFQGSKRLRLVVDEHGCILKRTSIDFGDRPLPLQSHRIGQ